MKFDSDHDIDNDDDYVTLSLEVLCKKAKMMNQILLEGERSFLRTRNDNFEFLSKNKVSSLIIANQCSKKNGNFKLVVQ